MSRTPLDIPSPPPRPSVTLSRLAAILATIFGVSFGLCGLAATVGMGVSQTVSRATIYATIVVEALSLLGLLVTGILAILQSIRRRHTHES